MDSSVSSKLRSKLQRWKEDLAELSKRNNLLKFREEKKSTIKVLTPGNYLFEKLVVEQKALPIKSLETQQKDTKLLKCLKQLRKNSNSIEKEKGINSLFVAIGTLTWSFRDDPDDLITSPILLIPVKLHTPRGREDHELQPIEETISINPVLVQKLRVDYGISFPAIEIEQVADFEKLFDEIAQDPDVAERTNWGVNKDAAFVGLFQRAKASMIKDLEYLEQNLDIVSNHLVLSGLANEQAAYTTDAAKCLSDIPKPHELDKRVDPENVFQVLEADSSQQTVIEAAKYYSCKS